MEKIDQIMYRTQAIALVVYVTRHRTIELHSQNAKNFIFLTTLYKI